MLSICSHFLSNSPLYVLSSKDLCFGNHPNLVFFLFPVSSSPSSPSFPPPPPPVQWPSLSTNLGQGPIASSFELSLSQALVGPKEKGASQESRAGQKRKRISGKRASGEMVGNLKLARGLKILENGSPSFCVARGLTRVLALTIISQQKAAGDIEGNQQS